MMTNEEAGANRGCLWWEGTARQRSRPTVEADRSFDVVIVGGGFTGLWTAYYLSRLDPSLRVAVVEATAVGAGASGRNGGFCTAVLPVGLSRLARRHGERAAIGLQTAAVDTLDEIESVLQGENIVCGWRRGGTRWVATDPTQQQRLVAMINEYRRFGFGPDHIDAESLSLLATRLTVSGAVGAAYSPHGAAINPAQLVLGLANAVERNGTTIFEHSPATDVTPGRVITRQGEVSAPVVVRATEGYTAELTGDHRRLLPVYSHMIGTEPLSSGMWSELGWDDHATVADMARHFFYAQRTPDDRIAIGGRGFSYHWGSRVGTEFEADPTVTDRVHATLTRLFPVVGDVEVSHRWGGVLAVPRNWEPFVTFEPSSGLGSAGGYTGDGVLMSNLAARILAARITGSEPVTGGDALQQTVPRRWEPEPLRWTAVRLLDRGALLLDDRTSRRRPARLAEAMFDRIIDR